MLKKVSTDKAPSALGPYSQAIICGDMLYTSGQIPINPETGAIEATGHKICTIETEDGKLTVEHIKYGKGNLKVHANLFGLSCHIGITLSLFRWFV